MPRPRKRKSPEPTLNDPLEYVAMYCNKRGISSHVGSSDLEKECNRYAQQAREDYKRCREAGESENSDRKGMSPAEKYTIRLQNNRRSAEASKVYNEVLKREHAHILGSLPADYISQGGAFNYHNSHKTIVHLRSQIQQLLSEKESLQSNASYEKSRADKLQAQMSRYSKPAHAYAPVRTSIPLPLHHSTPQTSLAAHHHQLPVSSHMPTSNALPPTHPPLSSQLPSQSPSQSQQQLTPPESNQDNNQSSQLSLHQRLVSSRGVIHQPWSLSPMPQDSEAKEFHTGLTMTQSQNDEGDEKGQLVRTSLPLSSALPLAFLASQPSQSDMPVFKSSIGSEDMPIPPESEFFSLGSQGKGRAV